MPSSLYELLLLNEVELKEQDVVIKAKEQQTNVLLVKVLPLSKSPS